MIGALEEYFGHAQNAASKGGESKDALRSDPALNQATVEIITLLERFANGRSIDTIKAKVQVLYEDARQDDSLRDWFKQVDSWARKVIVTILCNYFFCSQAPLFPVSLGTRICFG